MRRKRVVIMGAAGRDFHNFNVCFRDDPSCLVRAFTAGQIPFTAGRTYPASLAGKLYPGGIPILDESELPELLKRERVDEVVFAYSDVSQESLMHKGSAVLAAGADFRLIGPAASMLQSRKPVISVCAVRTGCGKSGLSRLVCRLIAQAGLRPVVVRHPMPYGDLEAQAVQRFETLDDLVRERCTIEEREEYEPHLSSGVLVFAGVDYARVLRAAEAEGEVIVWDGGNNDFPFFRPDLEITMLDPTRPGDWSSYYPGEVNLLRAEVLVINKCNLVSKQTLAELKDAVRQRNAGARIVTTDSVISVEFSGGLEGLDSGASGAFGASGSLQGKRVLVVEDGPSVTHGGHCGGAGLACARNLGACVVDPRTFAVGSLAKAYQDFPHLGPVLPALGYSQAQLADLAETVARVPCDLVLAATPIDLAPLIATGKRVLRVRYEVSAGGELGLIVVATLRRLGLLAPV
jgi:predicted GTPase